MYICVTSGLVKFCIQIVLLDETIDKSNVLEKPFGFHRNIKIKENFSINNFEREKTELVCMITAIGLLLTGAGNRQLSSLGVGEDNSKLKPK